MNSRRSVLGDTRWFQMAVCSLKSAHISSKKTLKAEVRSGRLSRVWSLCSQFQGLLELGLMTFALSLPPRLWLMVLVSFGMRISGPVIRWRGTGEYQNSSLWAVQGETLTRGTGLAKIPSG